MGIFIVTWAPFLHDYGEWVFQGRVLHLKLADPSRVTGYELYSYPVPYQLAQYALAALNVLFEPIVAGKMLILVYVVATAVTIAAFCRRYYIEREQQLLAWSLLTLVAIFSSFFWYGYLGYQIGLILLLAFLAIVRSSISPALVMVFTVLAYFTHATIYLQILVVIGIAFITGVLKWRHLLAVLPSALLSAWFLIGRYLSGGVGGSGNSEWTSFTEAVIYKLGMVTMHGPFKNFLGQDGSSLIESWPLLYWAGVGTNVIIMVVLGVLGCVAMVRLVRSGAHERSPVGMLIAWVLAALVGTYCLAPYNFFGLVHAGGRVIVPVLALTLALVGLTRTRLPSALVYLVILVTCTTLAGYWLTTRSIDGPDSLRQNIREIPPASVATSVLAFNEWLYRNTRYKYYNYRIFTFSDRYRQLAQDDIRGLGFRTGPIKAYAP